MKPKRLPRLWCALQGLLPLEARRSGPPESLASLPEAKQPQPVLLPLKLHPRPLRSHG
jgi:hypothetical protein